MDPMMMNSQDDLSATGTARKRATSGKLRTDGGAKKAVRDAGSRKRRQAAGLSDEVQRLRGDFDAHVESSQQEVRRLSRRVHHLEQQLKQRLPIGATAVATQVPPSSAKSLFTFLGRPSLPSLS